MLKKNDQGLLLQSKSINDSDGGDRAARRMIFDLNTTENEGDVTDEA